MKTAHTPTPWKATDKGTIERGYDEDTPHLTDKQWDAIVSISIIAEVDNDEDAEFIVRAVNNHAALVEALDGLLAFVEGPFVDAKAREAHLDFAPHRAVLAAAKEGARR